MLIERWKARAAVVCAFVFLGVISAFAAGYDVDGKPLTRDTPFGDVDGSRSTVGQVADFGQGGGGKGVVTTNAANDMIASYAATNTLPFVATNYVGVVGFTGNVARIAKALKPRKIGYYLWEVGTEGEDWVAATNHLARKYPSYGNGGGCTGVQAGHLRGRNLDWSYDFGCSILIRSPRTEGRYASIGVSDGAKDLTDEFLMSEKWSDTFVSLPFTWSDGMNEHGVVIQQNVVQKDVAKSAAWRTNATGRVICFAIVRYALDRCSSARTAAELIRDKTFIPSEFPYDFHYQVSDMDETFIVEDGVVYSTDEIPTDVMTNFRVGGVIFGDDGKPDWATVEQYGIGVERYELVRNSGRDNSVLGGMKATMMDLWYTKTYLETTTPRWLTEFCGPSNETGYAGLTVMNARTSPELFNEKFLAERDVFAAEHDAESPSYRHGDSWQTTHMAIYDMNKLTLRLWTQESSESERLFYMKEGTDVTDGLTNGLATIAYAENAATNAVTNIVPVWARAENPPIGMPTTGLVWSATGGVRTYNGEKSVLAADVGAIPVSGGSYTGEVKVVSDETDSTLRLRAHRIDISVTNEGARVKVKNSTTETSASIVADDERSYLSLSGTTGGLDIDNTGKITTGEGEEITLPSGKSGTIALTGTTLSDYGIEDAYTKVEAGIVATNVVTLAITNTSPVFSNAVLAVGLGIDTNSVAVLNEIAATFGGFPLSPGTTATTVGGLLAALAAAIAWLRRRKFDSSQIASEWSGETTYALGANVTYDGKLYTSKAANNLNHKPTDLAWWTATGAFSTSNAALTATITATVPATAMRVSTVDPNVYELRTGAADPWDGKLDTDSMASQWTATAYQTGEFCTYQGKSYVATGATTASDVPGSSAKWVVAKLSTLFSSDNTSLTGQINYTIGASGNPADHTVRTLGTLSAATTLTIAAPRVAGALRDFAITFTEPETAVSVAFSTADAAGSSLTFYGEFLTPADGKTYIYYLTEIAANTFLVKGEEITTVAPTTL